MSIQATGDRGRIGVEPVFGIAERLPLTSSPDERRDPADGAEQPTGGLGGSILEAFGEPAAAAAGRPPQIFDAIGVGVRHRLWVAPAAAWEELARTRPDDEAVHQAIRIVARLVEDCSRGDAATGVDALADAFGVPRAVVGRVLAERSEPSEPGPGRAPARTTAEGWPTLLGVAALHRQIAADVPAGAVRVEWPELLALLAVEPDPALLRTVGGPAPGGARRVVIARPSRIATALIAELPAVRGTFERRPPPVHDLVRRLFVLDAWRR